MKAMLLGLLAQAAAAPAPPACTAAEYHQLDFWVGRWDVYPTGKDQLVAHSLIESVYGCGIRENWMPIGKPGGGSLSIYVPGDKHWEQFWIDSSGTRAFFTGGWDGTAMVISGKWGGPLQQECRRIGPAARGAVDRRGQDVGDELRLHVPAGEETLAVAHPRLS